MPRAGRPMRKGSPRGRRVARARARRAQLLQSLLDASASRAPQQGALARPRRPLLDALREARLRRLQRRLGFRQQVVDELRVRLNELQDLIEAALGTGGGRRPRPTAGSALEELLTELEDGGYATEGDFPDTPTTGGAPAPAPAPTPAPTPTPSPATGAGKLTRRDETIREIFEDMAGEDSEWTEDHRPKVHAVNDRLESLGQEPSNRKEIDEVYDRLLEERGGKPLTRITRSPRQRAFDEVFDDMHGQRSEFTEQGMPKVEAVNNRLESLDQEPATRKEIDAAYKVYQGEQE